MITLYGAVPLWGLPDPSPFVVKVEVLLKMAGLAFEKRPADFSKLPRGKIPYLDDAGEIVPDSTLIRLHIARKYGHDFEAGLSPARAGALWAAEKMCEDHLYFFILNERWLEPGNFAIGPRQFFSPVPAPMRPFVVWSVLRKIRRNIDGHGLSRYTPEERRILADKVVAALAGLLGEADFAGGEAPCGADATIFAMLQGALCPHFRSDFPEIAARYPVIGAYIARMQARFYPA